MARIRTIKPEFWGSPTVKKLSLEARLLFLGLISNADDYGRLLGSARAVAGMVFPNDVQVETIDVAGWIDELERYGAVRRYSVEGVDYLLLPEWDTHQKISKRTESRLPAPPVVTVDSGTVSPSVADDSAQGIPGDSGETQGNSSPDLGPRTLDRGPRTVDHSPRGAQNAPPKADGLVGGYVDSYRRTHGQRSPSRQLVNQAGKAAKAMLAEGYDEDVLARCLSVIARENKSPSHLALIVADYESENARGPAPFDATMGV